MHPSNSEPNPSPERDPSHDPSAERPGSSLVELTSNSPHKVLAEASNMDDLPTIITPGLPPSAGTGLLAGQRIGHFEVMDVIGSGGMASVWKAKDTELARIVALKLLPTVTAADPEAVTRFKQEARAAAKLDHDNLARVYFCGEDRGQHFIAFEFVEGENLRQLLDRRGVLPAGECIRYMLQVSAGLHHAADRGVVHRDIKPSNLIITPDGRCKIVDMGLARHLESHTVNGGVTQSGVTLGTFDYISPEQALDPRRADVRSDIYSLGCTIYHVLTGRPPVPDGTAAKKLSAHQNDYPIDPRDLNPTVPDGLAVVLGRMMAKAPEKRYQTPAELTLDLNRLARELGLSVDGGTSEVVPHSVEPRLGEPFRLPFGLAVAAAVLTVGLAIVYSLGTTSTPLEPAPASQLSGPARPDPTPPTPPTIPMPEKASGVLTARELLDAVTGRDSVIVTLRAGAVYDLTTLPEGLVFTGAELTLRGEPTATETSRPVLRVAAASGDGSRPGSLTVRDTGRFVLKGVEVVIVDPRPGPTKDDPCGLLVQRTDRVEIEDCFLHASPDLRTAVCGLVASGEDRRGGLTLVVQYSVLAFGGTAKAVQLSNGRSTFREVGFGPHQTAVQLADSTAQVTVDACSFMLDRGGSAFSGGTVTSIGCVYADVSEDVKRQMPGMDDRPPVGVVHRTDEDAPAQFDCPLGRPANAYYRVQPPETNSQPVILTRTPWAATNPSRALAAVNPWLAFRLNLEDRRLRWPMVPHVLGLKDSQRPSGTAENIYGTGWPPQRPPLPVKAEAKQRVVYPDALPEDQNLKIYSSVAKAFEDLRPDEMLLLASNATVAVPNLPEKSLKATIQAYPGFQPQLVPSDDRIRRTDACLFPLVEGELSFVGLHISSAGRPALVTLGGGTTVTFRDCVLTMDETDGSPSAVVLLSEASREMSGTGPGAATPPQIKFENTLVRGHGRCVWVKAPRPFGLETNNTVIALDGPIIWADTATRETTGQPAAGRLRLDRSTFCSTGPLFELHGSTGKALSLSVAAERSLFAPISRRRQTVMLLATDVANTDEPGSFLSWSSGGRSTFGSYEPVIELRPTNGGRSIEWDAERWGRAVSDATTGVTVRFAGTITAARLNTIRPEELFAEQRTGDGASGWQPVNGGADVAKLPGPVGE